VRKHQTRNLEIPGSMLTHRPGMTAEVLSYRDRRVGKSEACPPTMKQLDAMVGTAQRAFAHPTNSTILRCFAGVRDDVLRLILPVVPICRIPTGIAFFPKSERSFAHPVSTRGALRDRHERRTRDAMDAIDHETNDVIADGEVAWSWRPDAGVKSAKMLPLLAGDGGKKARSPGRSRISRKTIAQGRPDDFG